MYVYLLNTDVWYGVGSDIWWLSGALLAAVLIASVGALIVSKRLLRGSSDREIAEDLDSWAPPGRTTRVGYGHVRIVPVPQERNDLQRSVVTRPNPGAAANPHAGAA